MRRRSARSFQMSLGQIAFSHPTSRKHTVSQRRTGLNGRFSLSLNNNNTLVPFDRRVSSRDVLVSREKDLNSGRIVASLLARLYVISGVREGSGGT